MSEKELSGRVAWVTGGATGIGKAIAIALASQGANIAIGSLSKVIANNLSPEQCVHLVSGTELSSAVSEIRATGASAQGFALDVCSQESVSSFHEQATAAFGKVDILVNAAGSTGRHTVVRHPDELWKRVIDVNLNGPFRTTRACLPRMMEQRWGRIVNIASTAANVGAPLHAAYCAAKSGLLGLTRCVALEGAEHGVTCNAINPGFVATPQNAIGLTQQMSLDGVSLSLDDYRRQISETIPQKRFVNPEEIAALAAFLCSERALAITAQDLTVAAGSQW